MTDTNSSAKGDDERRLAGYLRAVLDRLPQGVTVYDRDLNLVFANLAYCELMELSRETLDSLPNLADLVRYNAERGEYGDVVVEDWVARRVELARAFAPHRNERTRPDGRVLEIAGRPLNQNGEPVGFLSTYTDITNYRTAEESVRRIRDLMSDAIRHSSTYIWEVDATGRIAFIQGAEDVLGYASTDLIGQPVGRIEASEGGDDVVDEVAAAITERRSYRNVLIRRRRADGALIWVSSSGRPITNGDGGFRGFRGVDVDVTELTEVRLALERMALHDALTGLANRHKLLDRYRTESLRQVRSGCSLSLLVVDIDRFKLVNDTYGHGVGDEVLKLVAQTLGSRLRALDLAARFGGEEFVVLLPETDSDGAQVVAEDLRHAVEEATVRPALLDNTVVRVTISIGVATSERGVMEIFDDLMDHADRALYRAKNEGRNCVRVTPPQPASQGL